VQQRESLGSEFTADTVETRQVASRTWTTRQP
jgi:hypothetical protein